MLCLVRQWTPVHTSVYGGFEPVYLAVTGLVLVLPEVYRIMEFWEMTSGISCSILHPCLVRQRICLRQSTELFEDAHTFSTCRGTLGDDFRTVFVFSAVLGST